MPWPGTHSASPCVQSGLGQPVARGRLSRLCRPVCELHVFCVLQPVIGGLVHGVLDLLWRHKETDPGETVGTLALAAALLRQPSIEASAHRSLAGLALGDGE
eukprot:7635445-Prorocentrum_lima.AAC.1